MKMHWEKGKTILGLMRQVGKRRLILVIKKAELKRLKPGLCTGEYEGQKKNDFQVTGTQESKNLENKKHRYFLGFVEHEESGNLPSKDDQEIVRLARAQKRDLLEIDIWKI